MPYDRADHDYSTEGELLPKGHAATPIGMQIAAGPFQEDLIFAVAHAYEQATDCHKRRPALEAH